MSNGWEESASAWIADSGDKGDFSREHVLDRPMLKRVAGRNFKIALDVGCGEGRFCRKLSRLGIKPIGLDPTSALIAHAQKMDPMGDYRERDRGDVARSSSWRVFAHCESEQLSNGSHAQRVGESGKW